MNEELEALKRIETTFSMNKQGKESVYREYTNSIYPYYEDFDLVLNALKRLEAIDNANPSEALECLERAKDISFGKRKFVNLEDEINCFDTIKQALIKAQELESENNALLEENNDLYAELTLANKQYKELIESTKQYQKVLEIIVDKGVDFSGILGNHKVEKYNSGGFRNPLTEEEFDLLKRYVE